ncbi:MAG: glycosyltransferase, partial [Lentisphaerae bacterium]|nr:glycosyltransferase [Lentisphaerota bacterium]
MWQHALMQLSIVIPAFNESARLGRTLEAYLPYFTALYGEDFEVIVVVNGSVDNTESVAEAYAKKYRQIRVLVDPRRIGKGGAVIKGFGAAGGELVGFADADCATSPQAFHALIQNLGSAGAIIASRWLPESVLIPPQPLSRRISSRVFNLCVTALFGFQISDTQCGAKLLTR